jgi:hypothetical protein
MIGFERLRLATKWRIFIQTLSAGDYHADGGKITRTPARTLDEVRAALERQFIARRSGKLPTTEQERNQLFDDFLRWRQQPPSH